MGDGRKTLAPCGHVGEVVIGTYVQCPACDKKAVPRHVKPEKTEPLFAVDPRCPRCGSTHTVHFQNTLDSLGWFVQQPTITQTLPPDEGDSACWACGMIWTPVV